MVVHRWYKGYSYLGNPNELVSIISKQIQDYDLSQFVPVLRVEKGAKPRKQFYFFLAIESPAIGQVPSEVQARLLNLKFFRAPVRNAKGFTYEQIKSMVGIAHDVYAYTAQLPYNPTQNLQELNPFNLSGVQPAAPTDDSEAQSLKYERLLYWLSALGSGTWDVFTRACDALALKEPRRILRRLKLLGHLESSADGSRWSTTPTTLLTIGTRLNSPELALCGQRSAALIEELRQHGDLSSVAQPNGEASPCIRLRLFDSTELPRLIEQISSQFQIVDAGRASVRFAEILPDITVWQQGLRSLSGVLPHSYEIKRFDGTSFVDYPFQRETGLYELWVEESDPHPRYTLFYNREADRWFQGDWYGLRFLALHNLNVPLIARYHPPTAQLAIPFSQRWVEVYERPLVLASGKLPIYENGCLIYDSISPQLAHQMATKLHVNLQEESACA